jgi:UDP-N-acetylglucosamine acyltransferase
VTIHPTAIVADGASIAANVEIGPYCVVGQQVSLGDGVRLLSHVVVENRTEIGAGTVIYPFASIGHIPQDLKYRGEKSRLVIGERCQIREHVTMNPGTEDGGMITTIGNDCLFMASSHVAHDCIIGNNVIMANNATLAGHVVVGDYASIGGLSAVRQRVRIGPYAMIGGMSGVENDVIPYGLVMGERARLAGLNLVGLERRGFSRDAIGTLRAAYRIIFAPEGTLVERVEEAAKSYESNEFVTLMIDFIRDRASDRALCQPKGMNG